MPKFPNISASSIATFQRCQMDWYLRYVLGIEQIEEIEAFRVGNRWHRMLDLRNKGHDIDAVTDDLRAAYEADDIFRGGEWAYLNYGFLAYDWFYRDDEMIVEESERRFEIPAFGTKIVGVLDRVERLKDDRRYIRDYKTSGRDLDSDFWEALRESIQTDMYIWAGQQLGLDIAGMVYDAYRKPGIRPKLLTQGETKKFLKTAPMYEGTAFSCDFTEEDGVVQTITIEDEEVEEIKRGVKGIQMRETPLMYGARLLNLMYKDPTKYFARKEVTRTTKDTQWFGIRLLAHKLAMETVYNNPLLLFHSEANCSSKLCYHNRHNAVLSGETPDGWRRRYKDKTHEQTTDVRQAEQLSEHSPYRTAG